VVARSTPRVVDTVLVGSAGPASNIAVDSPAWYAWLEQATTFAFTSAQGSFTARKERRGRTGWYWKAYRKQAGTLHRAYLGKSADLTLDRLHAVANELAGRVTLPPPPESASVLAAAPDASPDQPARLTGAALPEGTLTFLFTDIEGSTRLWQQHPQAMPQALARHDAILRQTITAHRGVVFKTVGDGVYAVFARAIDALAAALAAQRDLEAADWGELGSLRVRMALHTGAAELRDGDYYGGPLNRLARILALGHGGQILLSHATRDLVADELPSHTSLRVLGEYSLKDLTRPEPIFQFVSPDLPSEFPPLRAATHGPTPAPSQALHLLSTKLYVPPPRAQLVPRPRLLARLDAGLSGKLTLLSAPAGYGKTTLLSAWRATPRGRAVPFAWVSLDAADSEPLRFWSYVITALDMLQPDIGAPALALLQAPQPPPIEAMLTPLLNALGTLRTDAVLVLDDYHLIDAPAIHSAVAFLLDHLPPLLHLVITTRADPPLPLTRLRARGQLSELRAADLRFTTEETAAFLSELMGLPLSADDIRALDARTEGWIAGLQFAALAMRDRSDLAGFIRAFTGSHRFVVDYLAEEVLARQPPHLQTFLTQTAILDRMCGPLCDAVLGITMNDESRTMNTATSSVDSSSIAHHSSFGDSYSQIILDQLERANLFVVPLDDDRHWYRYHHLFTEVLQARLVSGAASEQIRQLRQRASAWCEAQSLLAEAVQYALAAHDWDRVVRLIEQRGTDYALHGHIETVLGWLDMLPDESVRARPALCLLHAGLLLSTHQFELAAARLDWVEQVIPSIKASPHASSIVSQLAAMRSTLTRFAGDLPASVALGKQALQHMNGGRSNPAAIVSVGHTFLVSGNVGAAAEQQLATLLADLQETERPAIHLRRSMLWAWMRVMQGRLREAERVYRSAPQLIAGHERGLALIVGGAAYYFGLGDLLREWNDLDAASQLLEQGMTLARGTLSIEPDILLTGVAALARMYQARSQGSAARAMLREFGQLTQRCTVAAYLTARIAAMEAQFTLMDGDLLRACQWADTVDVSATAELSYLREWEYLTLARVRLAQGRADPAGAYLSDTLQLLDRLLTSAERCARCSSMIPLLILRALALEAQGNRRDVLIILERALGLAAPEGYVRIFVDEGAPLAALLTQVADRASPMAEYAAKLLTAFPATMQNERGMMSDAPALHPSSFIPQPLAEPLSERELEILRLIAEGHSNQAIADRLVVAVSTVKKHINNLYGKLDVQSRTQALARARELQLL
jgi:LuxR family maltose regulon positive regulatory protein